MSPNLSRPPTVTPLSPQEIRAVFNPNFSDGMDEDEESMNGDGDLPPELTERHFKDTVHGWIRLSPRICTIIDTPHFQRLRHVKQLGTSYYVWPAASHNRFEHCLGVAHLARTQIEWLKKLQPELNISQQDIDCVTIAGLCHDLGHGPWSHVWDMLFIPKALPGKKWKHEDASEMMFDDLIKEPTVEFSQEEATIVKALIAGDPLRCPNLKGKEFLFDIIANKRNGLDVDKFDYIARDFLAIGQGENISISKIIHSARVVDGQICYNIKDANTIFELCWQRLSLHKRIYNHKTAKAIEHMIIDAILAAEPYMHIAKYIEDPKRYLFLTDDIKLRIQATTEPELQTARDIFRRLDTRDLYKCVEYRVYPLAVRDICRERITPKTIVSAVKSFVKEDNELCSLVQELNEEHVIVDLSDMHCGMKERNPLNFVKFYSKKKPKHARHATSGEVSYIMPETFSEVLLRVYARDARFHDVIQLGYHQVLKAIRESEQVDEINLDSGSDSEEAPTTPRAPKRVLSRVTSKRFAPNEDEGPEPTVWGPNEFMGADGDANGERGRELSPSGKGVKRGAGGRSRSPPKKRGKVAK